MTMRPRRSRKQTPRTALHNIHRRIITATDRRVEDDKHRKEIESAQLRWLDALKDNTGALNRATDRLSTDQPAPEATGEPSAGEQIEWMKRHIDAEYGGEAA